MNQKIILITLVFLSIIIHPRIIFADNGNITDYKIDIPGFGKCSAWSTKNAYPNYQGYPTDPRLRMSIITKSNGDYVGHIESLIENDCISIRTVSSPNTTVTDHLLANVKETYVKEFGRCPKVVMTGDLIGRNSISWKSYIAKTGKGSFMNNQPPALRNAVAFEELRECQGLKNVCKNCYGCDLTVCGVQEGGRGTPLIGILRKGDVAISEAESIATRWGLQLTQSRNNCGMNIPRTISKINPSPNIPIKYRAIAGLGYLFAVQPLITDCTGHDGKGAFAVWLTLGGITACKYPKVSIPLSTYFIAWEPFRQYDLRLSIESQINKANNGEWFYINNRGWVWGGNSSEPTYQCPTMPFYETAWGQTENEYFLKKYGNIDIADLIFIHKVPYSSLY